MDSIIFSFLGHLICCGCKIRKVLQSSWDLFFQHEVNMCNPTVKCCQPRPRYNKNNDMAQIVRVRNSKD